MARFSNEIEEAVAQDYMTGILNLDQIAQKHKICKRSIYNIVERCIPRRCTKKAPQWVTARLERTEIELILLLILEFEGIVSEEKKPILHVLEEKMLAAADRDEELKRLGKN